MRLSSMLCAGLCLGALVAAPALAAGPGAARGMVHPTVAPRVLRVGPGQAEARRFRGDRRGYGFGGYGGYGFGLGGESVGTYSLSGAPSDAVAPEPPPLPIRPACPMVIKVGPGLDHPVRTQVIYGHPACD